MKSERRYSEGAITAEECSSNYFKKNSTSLLLYIRDLEIAVTQRIEFNVKKIEFNLKKKFYSK